jgi:acyl dehydratase
MTQPRVVEGDAGLTTVLRAALPSLPVVNQLPGIRKDSDADPSKLVVTRPQVEVSRKDVDAYAKVCGFPHKDTAPLPYPHMLAFPLHMAIMTDPAFPYPAIGSVHVENSITGHRPVRVGETLSVTTHATSPRDHAKGKVVDFVTTARADGELVWESTSTYLRRGKGAEGAETGMQFGAMPDGGVEWRLPGDLGRRYAAVSGDRNPIHLYPLTAKALGFPRQIAHGMWSKARCIAAIENRLPDAVRVEVAFKKPILLPGTVSFGTAATDDGHLFSLTRPKDGSPHLLGRATRL